MNDVASPASDSDRALRPGWFLEHACVDPILGNGPGAQVRQRAAALRILARHPDVARASIHTAAVCGDLEWVERILAERADAANERGGPVRRRYDKSRESQWTPLLHLCYGHLPTAPARENAVAIARVLLDHGADPNAYFEVGSHPSRYTALTGVVGGGEESSPPHAAADELVSLLLERGANPIDVPTQHSGAMASARDPFSTRSRNICCRTMRCLPQQARTAPTSSRSCWTLACP